MYSNIKQQISTMEKPHFCTNLISFMQTFIQFNNMPETVGKYIESLSSKGLQSMWKDKHIHIFSHKEHYTALQQYAWGPFKTVKSPAKKHRREKTWC